MTAETTTLVLPGIANSGPGHWQSRWEGLDPRMQRVHQDEWETPRCSDWVRRLDAAISAQREGVVLVGHSSACLLVAHWVVGAIPSQLARVRGALLVAPSDPEGSHYPVGPTGFGPVPLVRIPFPTIVVASTDDPYVSLEQAHIYASAWGSRLVVLTNAGHINAASGLGDWRDGLALLRTLTDPPPEGA